MIAVENAGHSFLCDESCGMSRKVESGAAQFIFRCNIYCSSAIEVSAPTSNATCRLRSKIGTKKT